MRTSSFSVDCVLHPLYGLQREDFKAMARAIAADAAAGISDDDERELLRLLAVAILAGLRIPVPTRPMYFGVDVAAGQDRTAGSIVKLNRDETDRAGSVFVWCDAEGRLSFKPVEMGA